MATNQYGQTYSGNDDFRGWLAAGNSAPVDYGNDWINNIIETRANVPAALLKYAGNDGGSSNGTLAALTRLNYDYWNSQRQDPVNQSGGYDASASASAQKASQDANARRGYDDVIARTNNSLNDLAGALQNRLDQIEGDYNTLKNEQESSYNQQKNSYDTSSRQNMNDLVANRNTITNNASRGLRSLQRILGAMGASGSSVAKYNVPEMVKSQADEQFANAGQTYAKNQSNLDTNWGNYLNSFENDKKKLEDWRTGQIKSAKQENEQNRINLLNQLSEAYVNRAQVGGDLNDEYKGITDRINQANQTIRDLGKYTTPQYTGTTAVYNAQPLSSYNTGNMNLAASVNNGVTSDSPTLLSTLQNLNKKKQNNGQEA